MRSIEAAWLGRFRRSEMFFDFILISHMKDGADTELVEVGAVRL